VQPARRDKFLECRHCAREKPLAGPSQADTTRRTDEEHRSEARIECAYRLTDGGRGHSELRGCPPKTAVLGDTQERLHAIEGALPNCEVLLHSLPTLLRIVGRGKRSYI
jgi:hypothetical protein